MKDDQPIILLGIVDTLIYFVTSFVTPPEKSQDANFLKNPLFLSRIFLVWLKSYSIKKQPRSDVKKTCSVLLAKFNILADFLALEEEPKKLG